MGAGGGSSTTYKAKDEAAGAELMGRLQALADSEGHPVSASAAGAEVMVEVSTAGKLTTNDFIMAAKVDKLDKAELLEPKKKKQKFWA
jgi:pterin-4a-carbinolamine dehydratase